MRTRLFILKLLIVGLVVGVGQPLMAQEDQTLEEKFAEGQELIAQEKLEEAITLFRGITESNEEVGAGWFFLGYALHMNGNLEEAMKVHKKAAGFDRFAGIATYNLGCAHALLQDKDAAIESLEKAIENGFNDPDQFETDSDLYSLHTDVRFARLMAGMDGQDKVIELLGEAENHLGQQDFTKAAEIYRAILEEDEDNAFATYRLGYALHGSGDLEAALKMHTKATNFAGVAPVATYNIACVHSLNGNKDEAMTHLEKSVEMGFVRLDALKNDPDLANVREEERFEKLVAKAGKILEQRKRDKKTKEDGLSGEAPGF